MSHEDQQLDDHGQNNSLTVVRSASDRVRLPAIFLIIVGVLNIPGALQRAVSGIIENWFKKRMELITDVSDMPEPNPSQGRIGGAFFYGWCVISLIAAAITIIGGVRMLSLKSYGLAILASVLAAIPFISTMGCFGIGAGIGIWSLVVLMNADVKTAFR